MAFLALFALSACSQSQLEHQTDAFNRASATTISEQTLLNAVRASLDMPMSFTKLQKFTAESVARGTLAPTNVLSPRIFGLGPTLDLSGGVEAIEYVDVNNSGALAKLNKTVGYDTIQRYRYQGYDSLLLHTLLVEYVAIHRDLAQAINEEARRRCRNTSISAAKLVCDELASLRVACRPFYEGGSAFLAVPNRARSRCEFLRFQVLSFVLALSGFELGLEREASKSGTTGIAAKTVGKTVNVTVTNILPDGKPRTASEATSPAISFAPAVYRKWRLLHEKFEKQEKWTKLRKQPFKIVLRSPKSLLAYLGELIALQNFGKERYVPEIPIFLPESAGALSRMTLFRVVRGPAAGVAPALSVRGPDGELYVVPRPEYGSVERDQTLRVLAIASEMVNGAISEKDFPAPASIVIRGR